MTWHKHIWLLAAAGLLALLTAPYWLVKLPGYSPEDKWLETSLGAGNYHFFAREIYEKKGDIDILVLGDSLIWCGLDTDRVQDALSKKLGRQAVVRSFAANWRGEDVMYEQLKELTAHRHVKMLVLDLPVNYKRNDPHVTAAYWWVPGEHLDDMAGVDMLTRLKLYAAGVLGTPRHLLSLIRPNRMLSEQDAIRSNSKTGALLESIGFNGTFRKRRQPLSFSFTPESIIYGDQSAAQYEFTRKRLDRFQDVFIRKLFTLAAKEHIHVVVSEVPVYSQVRNTKAREIFDYRKEYPGFIDIASVAPDRLFHGVPDEAVQDYYYDEHMNTNGSTFYTNAMLPALLALYAKKPGRL